MNLTKDVIKFFLLGLVYWAYIVWFARSVIEDYALLVNGFLVPFLVGSVAYLTFRSQSLVRIILATNVSLIAALVTAGGGDPAMPGLHLVAIATMTAITFLGAIITAGAVVTLRAFWSRL